MRPAAIALLALAGAGVAGAMGFAIVRARKRAAAELEPPRVDAATFTQAVKAAVAGGGGGEASRLLLPSGGGRTSTPAMLPGFTGGAAAIVPVPAASTTSTARFALPQRPVAVAVFDRPYTSSPAPATRTVAPIPPTAGRTIVATVVTTRPVVVAPKAPARVPPKPPPKPVRK